MIIALYVVTILVVLIAAFYSAAQLWRPSLIGLEPLTEPTRTTAMYGAARTIPLAGAVIFAVAMGQAHVVAWLGALACVEQLADAAIGVRMRDAFNTIVPLVMAAVQLAVVIWFFSAAA